MFPGSLNRALSNGVQGYESGRLYTFNLTVPPGLTPIYYAGKQRAFVKTAARAESVCIPYPHAFRPSQTDPVSLAGSGALLVTRGVAVFRATFVEWLAIAGLFVCTTCIYVSL